MMMNQEKPRWQRRRAVSASSLLVTISVCSVLVETHAFMPSSSGPRRRARPSSPSWAPQTQPEPAQPQLLLQAMPTPHDATDSASNSFQQKPIWEQVFSKSMLTFAAAGMLTASLAFAGPVFAENELSAKYGGGGIDTSLVDQTCLLDKCSVQAKACLADDPSCRKGLTCTAKCLGDNACITGCMARYGNKNLDNLLKCTIEDNDCIKIAILPGGADKFGEESKPPAPTVANFNPKTLAGSWYKVVGYNPNYDCYACQRNTFSSASGGILSDKKLDMEVEFSMPHLLPDGTPPPPSNVRENIREDSSHSALFGSKSIALNDYRTHETMVFDRNANPLQQLVLNTASGEEQSYARTAHSEGEMFGLKFWENWFIIGENDPGNPDFKFVYYNGKTRQNTYEGAFVYSRTKELSPESMQKVYKIAKDAGMNPDQFCRIRNGCFNDETIIAEPESGLGSPSNPFRGILASTRISQLLGVESVAARDMVRKGTPTAKELQPETAATVTGSSTNIKRAWWYNVGDYLENPHRHFQAMDDLRVVMEWPEDVKS